MNSKRLKSPLTLILLALLFIGLSNAAVLGRNSDDPWPFVTVRILHTNDIHGHLLPEPDLKAGTPPPFFGGAPSLATAIKRLRNEPVFGRKPDIVFYVDAGDIFQGTPEGNLTHGESVIELFRMLDITALAAGNHDFDFGPETLERLCRLADWPVLAANVRSDSPGFPLRRHAVFRHDPTGIQIALFGLITDDMTSVTTAQARRGFTFDSSVPAARREVAELRDSAHLVIAVSHTGVKQDRRIADTVAGIDVIIGGHSHTVLSPYYKNDTTGTVVVQAGNYLKDLGVLDLLYNRQTRKIVRSNSRLIPLYRAEFPPDPAVQRWLARLSRNVGAILDKPVAVSDSDYLKASDTECVPGNLLTDAMRWATGADVAFQNSFGIRADLPKGTITLRTLFTIMPFDNTIVAMNLTGAQILDLLEQSATQDRGFLQMSGVHAVFDVSRKPKERVLFARIGGKPLDLTKTYRVATNSFLAEGGDLFGAFAKGTDRADNGQNMRDAVRDYLKTVTGSTGGIYAGRIEERIIRAIPQTARAR